MANSALLVCAGMDIHKLRFKHTQPSCCPIMFDLNTSTDIFVIIVLGGGRMWVCYKFRAHLPDCKSKTQGPCKTAMLLLAGPAKDAFWGGAFLLRNVFQLS